MSPIRQRSKWGRFLESFVRILLDILARQGELLHVALRGEWLRWLRRGWTALLAVGMADG